MRYTKNVAHEDLAVINKTLVELGHDCRLVMQGRNGYQGLDEYNSANTCLRTVATGTPRECIAAANTYLTGVALDKVRRI